MASSLSITFLGTSSAQPSNTRNMSSLCFRIDGDIWLFDCGEGTQHQFHKSDLKPSKIQSIFITHNHGDHIFGLPGLLCTLSGGITEEGRTINIFGPKGIRLYLRNSLSISSSFLNFYLKIHELLGKDENESCNEEGKLPFEIIGENIKANDNGLWYLPKLDKRIDNIIAGPLEHTIPSIGYVITEVTLPGSLDANAIKPRLLSNKEGFLKQGIKNPMSLMRNIKMGETINLPDGSCINPKDVIGPSKKGRKITILGDTSNSNSLINIAQNSDVIIHESTNAKVGDEEKTFEQVEETTKEHGHSTPQMAGKFAKLCNAKMLLLNHFSARYKGDNDPKSLIIMKEIENLAKNEFKNDKVIATHDFFSINIPRK